MRLPRTREGRLWTTAALVVGLAAALGAWLSVRGPSVVSRHAREAASERQALLADNGAARVGHVLRSVRRRLEDPDLREATGLSDTRDPEALTRALGAIKGGALAEYGVALLVHDDHGDVKAVDPDVPEGKRERILAHRHVPMSGSWHDGGEATLCEKCRRALHTASVSVPLASGLRLGVEVDLERMAQHALRDLHRGSGQGAWLRDHHGHLVDASGELVDEGAEPDASRWLSATSRVPGTRGWTVTVAADRAAVAARFVGDARRLLLGSGGIVGLLVLGGLLGGLALRDRQHRERQRLERLAHQEKLASLGEVAARVGHEMRNLLTVARGNVDFSKSVAEDEESREALGETREALDRLGEIGEDLRRYARRREEEPTPLALSKVAHSAVRLVRPRVKKRYDIEVEAGSEPSVEGRPGRLTQLLVNLLNNAVDAMEEGGHGSTIRVRIDEAGPYARIRVSDQGPGLEPDAAERLFQPFFTTKDDERGTGLGLALCARIAEEHGGEIRAENGAEGGAVFVVDLPTPDADEAEAEPEPAPAPSEQGLHRASA